MAAAVRERNRSKVGRMARLKGAVETATPRLARSIIAAEPDAGLIMSPASLKHRSNMLPGGIVCRTIFRTARPPRHYGRSAIWTSPSRRRSNLLAASAGTNRSPYQIEWLAPVGPQEPPARRCVSLCMGTPRRAGPPYGLPAQATMPGGQFWTPIDTPVRPSFVLRASRPSSASPFWTSLSSLDMTNLAP